MLLNAGNVIYFGNNGVETREFTTIQNFFDFQREDYWLFEFSHGHYLKNAFQHLPSDTLNHIRSGNVKLVLNNSHEAFHDYIENIYQYFVDDLNIPAKQIILLSESATIHHVVNEVAARLKQDTFTCYWMRIFEYDVNKAMSYADYKNIYTLESKPYPKKFLNLNRRWRIHRPMLVGLLAARNLLQHGYVSLASNVEGQSWANAWNSIHFLHFLQNTELQKELVQHQSIISNLPDLYLDTTDLQTNQADVNSLLDQHYIDTYFSVVTETNFFKEFGEGVFLSEKIFKPILKKHPFISVARPHTLKELKRIGYRTFHPYIDETYDTIENDSDRLIAIVNEIERLCNLSNQEREEYLFGLRSITQYNFQVLKSKRGTDYYNLLQK